MLRELTEALEVLTETTPLLLVLEDLQWSDFSTVDLISLLAQRRGRARLMLVGTYRPADLIVSSHPMKAIKQELQVRGQCEELALGCLGAAEVNQYLTSRFPAHSPTLGQLIHQTTDGNPLFIINVVDYWLSLGVLVETDGHWRLTTDAANARVGVPESLSQMIEKQLERLIPQERHVLEAASVAGKEFTIDIVAAALGEKQSPVEEWCEGLAERGQFLRAHGSEIRADGAVTGRYGFIHALYQQVLYERISAVRRLHLHRQFGRWLEVAHGGRTDEVAAQLAVHFELGKSYEQAVNYLRQAAERAGRLQAPHEAATLLGKALDLLRDLPETPEHAQQELGLRIALGVPLLMTKGYAATEVEYTYARARELCEQLGECPQLIPALAGLFKFYFVRAEFHTARELAERVMRLAELTSDRFVMLAAHSLLGTSLLSIGEMATARAHLEQGIALYDPLQHGPLALVYGDDPGVVCLSFAALALWFMGCPDQALQRSQEALALARNSPCPIALRSL
jgi:predicted ATPase